MRFDNHRVVITAAGRNHGRWSRYARGNDTR